MIAVRADSLKLMEERLETLDVLKLGERATIRDVSGDDGVAVRLLEMGLTPGEEIEMIGRAPLGDPIESHLRGFRLSLRRDEAQRIVIDRTE